MRRGFQILQKSFTAEIPAKWADAAIRQRLNPLAYEKALSLLIRNGYASESEIKQPNDEIW